MLTASARGTHQMRRRGDLWWRRNSIGARLRTALQVSLHEHTSLAVASRSPSEGGTDAMFLQAPRTLPSSPLNNHDAVHAHKTFGQRTLGQLQAHHASPPPDRPQHLLARDAIAVAKLQDRAHLVQMDLDELGNAYGSLSNRGAGSLYIWKIRHPCQSSEGCHCRSFLCLSCRPGN